METRKRDTDTPQKRHSYTRNWCDFASVCMYTHKRDVYVYVRPRRYIVPFYIDTHLCTALQSGKPALHIFVHTAFIYLYMYICMYIYISIYVYMYVYTALIYIYICIYVCIYLCIPPLYIYICIYVCIYMYICTYVCIFSRAYPIFARIYSRIRPRMY